jgi:hypothetical protein
MGLLVKLVWSADVRKSAASGWKQHSRGSLRRSQLGMAQRTSARSARVFGLGRDVVAQTKDYRTLASLWPRLLPIDQGGTFGRPAMP